MSAMRLLSVVMSVMVIVAGTLVIPAEAAAQASGKVPYIGYMSPGDIPRYDNAFLQGLQEEGYILPGEIARYDDAFWFGLLKRGRFEGQKIRVEVRATAENYPQHAPALAAELVRLNVDLIYASTPPESKAAQLAVHGANKTTPIVFGPHNDPVGAQMVSSLARPGGNITGLAFHDPELLAKLVEILKETFPRITKVAYVHESAVYPAELSLRAKKAVQASARTSSVRLDIFDVQSDQDLDVALQTIADGRYDAMVITGGPLCLKECTKVVAFSLQRRIPAIYTEALFVEVGGLMSYGPPYVDRVRASAAVVARILRGAKPGDIPVEQPTRFRLLINPKAVKALRVTIPEAVLLRAEMIDGPIM